MVAAQFVSLFATKKIGPKYREPILLNLHIADLDLLSTITGASPYETAASNQGP